MKKIFSGLTVAALVFGLFSAPVQAASFTDSQYIPTWASAAIDSLVSQGVVSGYTDGRFGPTDALTRGQFAKIAVLASSTPVASSVSDSGFSDISASHWAAPYAKAAKDNGILSGYADGRFGVDDSVTRAQAAKILVNAFGLEIDTSAGPTFPDVASSEWFYDFVETAYSNSVINGYQNGNFGPNDTVTRAQAAVMTVGSQNPVARVSTPTSSNDTTVVTPVATTSEGILTVSVDASTPVATSVADGTAYNNFLTIKMSADNAGDIDVTSMRILRGGISTNSNVSGISVWTDSVRHGEVATSLGDDNAVTLGFGNSPITVPAGTSKMVYVKVNIDSAANNGTMFVSVNPADIVSNAKSVNGSNMIGNLMTVIDGDSIVGGISTIAFQAAVAASTVDIGSMDQLLARLDITTNANEDIHLSGINFYNNGNSTDGDITNLKLVDQNGTVIATLDSTTNKFANFVFATPYLIDKGTTDQFYVRGDVVDGSSRTIIFSVQNDYDVIAKGLDTGSGILPDLQASISGDTITVSSGSVSVSRSSASPSGKVARGGKTVTLATFDVRASGEDFELRQLAYYITRGDTVNLNGTLKIVNSAGATLYSVSAADAKYNFVNSGSITLTTYQVIKSAATETLSFVADIGSTATTSDTYAVTVANLYGKRVSTNDLMTVGTAVTGNTMTVDVTTLIVSKNTSFPSTNIVRGSSFTKVGSFNLEAGSAESIRVSSLAMKAVKTGTNFGYNNMTLVDNATGTQIGVVQASLSNDTAVTFSPSDYVIAAGSTRTIDVFVDTNTTMSASDTVVVSVTSISATGQDSGSSIYPNNGSAAALATALTGQTITISANGVITVSSDSASVNSIRLMHSGEINESVFVFKVDADNAEDLKIEKLYFGALNAAGNMTSFRLYDDAGVELGSTVSVNNGEIKFTGLNYNLVKAATKSLTLKASSTVSGTLTGGDKVYYVPSYIEYTGQQSGTQSKLYGTAMSVSAVAAGNGSITVNDGTLLVAGTYNVYSPFSGSTLVGTVRVLTVSGNTITYDNAAAGSVAFSGAVLGTGTILTSQSTFNSGVTVYDSEPVITVAASNPQGTLTPSSSQVIGAYTITNQGDRTMTIAELAFDISSTVQGVSGSTGTITAFTLWKDNTSIANGSIHTGSTTVAGMTGVAGDGNVGGGNIAITQSPRVRFLPSNITISPNSSITFEIKANTSNIKIGSADNNITLSLSMPGTAGNSTISNSDNGLSWSYTNINSVSTSSRASDSYPLNPAAITY